MPGSPDSGGSGRDEAPSQLEELADFMGQVGAFSRFCFDAFRYRCTFGILSLRGVFPFCSGRE